MIFKDRKHAGQELARRLTKYAGVKDAVVIGLPRGGVVVAYEVAEALSLPLDIIVTRKIGAEGNREYAIGAITEDGDAVWDESERSAADPGYLEKALTEERAEAQRRVGEYRGGHPPLTLVGETALIVDDGVATGFTMRAAIGSARKKGAARVVVAVPHGAAESLRMLEQEADEVIAIDRPEWYGSVGEFYQDFPQIEDEEVKALLVAARRP